MACGGKAMCDIDVLLVIDLEATCDEGDVPIVTQENQEVIEFPLVALRLSDGQVLHQDQVYVRPTMMEGVTRMCTNLTGITRPMLEERGVSLAAALERHDAYVKTLTEQGVSWFFATDGRWDFQHQLIPECERKGIPLAPHWRSYVNIQQLFQRHRPHDLHHPSPSLHFMANCLRSEKVGHHHCGLDDCLTIVGIVRALLAQGCGVERKHDVTVVPLDYDWTQDPTCRDFNASALNEDQVTADEVIQAYQFEPNRVLNIYWLPYAGPRQRELNFVLVVREYRAQRFMRRRNSCCQVYEEHEFARLLVTHNDVPFLLCETLPPDRILLRRVPFRNQANPRLLMNAARSEFGCSFSSGQRNWLRGEKERACHWMAHSIKCCGLVLQYVEHGRVLDWSQGDERFQDITPDDFTCWEQLWEHYAKRFRNPVFEQIKKRCHEIKHAFLSEAEAVMERLDDAHCHHQEPGKLLRAALRAIPVSDLAHKAAVTVSAAVPSDATLLHLYAGPHAVLQSGLVRLCNSLILQSGCDMAGVVVGEEEEEEEDAVLGADATTAPDQVQGSSPVLSKGADSSNDDVTLAVAMASTTANDTVRIVAWAHPSVLEHDRQFFGHGWASGAFVDSLDRATLHAYEWLDGVQMVLWHWHGKWRVASANDAMGAERLLPPTVTLGDRRRNEEAQQRDDGRTLADVFWSTWNVDSGLQQAKLNPGVTYAFLLRSREAVACRPSAFGLRALEQDALVLVSARQLDQGRLLTLQTEAQRIGATPLSPIQLPSDGGGERSGVNAAGSEASPKRGDGNGDVNTDSSSNGSNGGNSDGGDTHALHGSALAAALRRDSVTWNPFTLPGILVHDGHERWCLIRSRLSEALVCVHTSGARKVVKHALLLLLCCGAVEQGWHTLVGGLIPASFRYKRAWPAWITAWHRLVVDTRQLWVTAVAAAVAQGESADLDAIPAWGSAGRKSFAQALARKLTKGQSGLRAFLFGMRSHGTDRLHDLVPTMVRKGCPEVQVSNMVAAVGKMIERYVKEDQVEEKGEHGG